MYIYRNWKKIGLLCKNITACNLQKDLIFYTKSGLKFVANEKLKLQNDCEPRIVNGDLLFNKTRWILFLMSLLYSQHYKSPKIQ